MSRIQLLVDGVQVYDSGAATPSPVPNPTPTPTPMPTPAPVDPNIPLLTTNVPIRNYTVDALGSRIFQFTLPSTAYAVQMSMGTQDWTTDIDMFVKKGSVPTLDDYQKLKSSGINGAGPNYWSSFGADSNETFYMWNVPAGTYYIFLHNNTNMGGKFELMFSVVN